MFLLTLCSQAAIAKLEAAHDAERSKARAELEAAKGAFSRRQGELRVGAEAASRAAAAAVGAGQAEMAKRMAELENAIQTCRGNANTVQLYVSVRSIYERSIQRYHDQYIHTYIHSLG